MRGCSVLSIRHCVANGRDMELRARTSMGGNEYRVFETVKLPGGKILVPGAAGTAPISSTILNSSPNGSSMSPISSGWRHPCRHGLRHRIARRA